MTSGLNAADTDYDILMFVDQGNTRGSIVTADIDLEKWQDDPLISRKCDYLRQNLRAFNVGSHVIFLKTTNYGIAIIGLIYINGANAT